MADTAFSTHKRTATTKIDYENVVVDERTGFRGYDDFSSLKSRFVSPNNCSGLNESIAMVAISTNENLAVVTDTENGSQNNGQANSHKSEGEGNA